MSRFIIYWRVQEAPQLYYRYRYAATVRIMILFLFLQYYFWCGDERKELMLAHVVLELSFYVLNLW